MNILNRKKQIIIAVSGVKNSGKTTLIEKLVTLLHDKGVRTAVIKHDGHDFEPDVAGTDSYRFREAGAEGVAVYSASRVMVIKEQPVASETELIGQFPDADLIILEGFKWSDYPKIEVVRSANSEGPVCRAENLIGLYTDLSEELLPADYDSVPVFGLDEVESLAEAVYSLVFR